MNPDHFANPTQEGKDGVKKVGKGAKKRAREEKEASIRAAEMARCVWGQVERVDVAHICTYLSNRACPEAWLGAGSISACTRTLKGC